MDRRHFLRRGVGRVGEAAVSHVDAQVAKLTRCVIRPPGALAETEFLLQCDRCGACIEACEHNVLFKLDAEFGFADGSPAMDLLNHGCHCCLDWPCIDACPGNALAMPEPDHLENMPALAKVVLVASHCLPYQGPECGACAESCPVPGALFWQDNRPLINQLACNGCAMCREACISEPKAFEVVSLATWSARQANESN